MTLKFFKSLHDKNQSCIPEIQKSLLKPIIERLEKAQNFQKQEKNGNNCKLERLNMINQSVKQTFEFGERLDRLEKFGNGRPKVKSTEPRSEYKFCHQKHTSNATPIQKGLNRSSNTSTKEFIPNRVQSQINYIGNALGSIKKKIEKFSDSFQLDQVNEKFNTFDLNKSKTAKKNRVKAGIIVQKTLKMWKDRKKFIDLRKKVIRIQRAFRKFTKRRELKRKSLTQSTRCSFYQQFSFQTLKSDVKNVECQIELEIFCENLGISGIKSKRLNFWKSLISLQRGVRKFLYHQKMVRAAVFIQKYFRRFIVRKKFFELIKVVKVSNRMERKALIMIKRDNVEKIDIIFKSNKKWAN